MISSGLWLYVNVCERWWVVGGAAWGEALGCCHRHIRAKHQSSPFIRGCLGLSAPPSADEPSIIDQTKYIQQRCYHYFSQLGILQPAPEEQEGFFLKHAKLTYIGVIPSILINSNIKKDIGLKYLWIYCWNKCLVQ